MLVSAKEMLDKAKAGHYAVGQFNINNLEWTKSILLTAQEMNSPVILGVSEGAGKYMTGFKTVAAMVKAMIEELNITVPVALHLDHGSYEGCLKCVEAGFSSIMFDGSHYPIDENVEKTKELVAVCKEKGMSLEAEVGSIGGEEDGVVGMGECADPNECKMIADLGVDMLAAGIGNIHGVYPANWQGLSFETLAAVQELTGTMPLVLHGGTGIPDDMIKKAIDLGVSKINVNTECQLAFAAATRKYIEEGKDQQGKGFDPRKLLAPGTDAIKATVKEKMDGTLSTRGAKKAADFVNFCDAFCIPVLTITNVTGFKATKCSERTMAKNAAALTAAFANATVPKVNVVVGKAYGSAYVVMNSKSIGADMVFAWPNAEIGMMDAKSAAKIMYEGSDAATINEKAAEYATLQNNVTSAARRGYVDLIVDPADTRKYLVDAFELLYTKCAYTPDKKHGTK